MIKFNREEGLTLIELLITIAVIAIVAAISVPVISNVVDSSRTNAAKAMTANAQAFSEKYNESGALSYADGVLTGFVDLNGNGTVEYGTETMETLTIDQETFGVLDSEDGTEVANDVLADGAAFPTGATLTNFFVSPDPVPAV
jgi:type IV pilus assembly protein PilA